MVFISILLYFMFPHWSVNILSFFLYVFGLLVIVTELGQRGNRGGAFVLAGIGFLVLTMMFLNSDNVIIKVIFILLSTITFLIFLASFIEAHEDRKKHSKADGKKKEFNNTYQTSLEVLSVIGSISSVIGLVYGLL